MNQTTLFMIGSIIIGGLLVAQGLPGLLTSDMIVRGRYGYSTHYSGSKATVLGFGYVGAGAFILLNGIILMLRSPEHLNPADSMLYVGIVLLPLCWVITLFVGGTAEREG